MKKQSKIILSLILLLSGLTIFILQLFVFEAPDGMLGFWLCLFSIYLMIGSIFWLCKLSSKFKNTLITMLDLIFFIK